jgi:hypothetical protein
LNWTSTWSTRTRSLQVLEANNTAGQAKAFGININAGTPEVAFVTAGGGHSLVCPSLLAFPPLLT